MVAEEIYKKMDNAIAHFEKELTSIRTSRASSSMLDNMYVDCYGSKTPLNQLGNINIPDANTIIFQVWDVNILKNIENTLIESNLGINPQIDGTLIRLPIPKLSEERRDELSKLVSQISENSKVTIRNIRREILEDYKNQQKEKNISQDDLKINSSNVQKITDDYIKKIDLISNHKKTEIITV